MVRSLRSVSILALVLMSVACTTPQVSVTPASPAKVADTKAVLRDLWLGHILGIRNVAVATMDQNAAARESAEKSVVANAEQIAKSIEPFYGKPASEKLFSLLAGHYGAIRDDLDATVAGNAAQDRKSTRLNSSHSQQSRMPSSA